MNFDILDTLLKQFENIFTGGLVQVEGYAVSLFGLLISIDLILSILLNLQDGDHIKILIKKILKYGFWIFLITNYHMIVNAILDSFAQVGISIGSGASIYLLQHPSKIFAKGVSLAYPYIQYLLTLKGLSVVFANPGLIVFTLIGVIVIIASFMIIAVQILLTYCEFYLFACMFLIFIPFGSNKYTAFLAEKAIGGIIAYGVKLMVLGTILGILAPIIQSWSIICTETPKIETIFGAMVASVILAILCWQIPSLAAGVMQGAPVLSAGTVANNIGAAAAGIATVATAGAGAAAGSSAIGGAAAVGGNVGAMQQAAGAINAGAGAGASGTASSAGSTAASSGGAQTPTFYSPKAHYAGSSSSGDSGMSASSGNATVNMASASSSGGNSDSPGTPTANMASAVGASSGVSSPAASGANTSASGASSGTAPSTMSSVAGTAASGSFDTGATPSSAARQEVAATMEKSGGMGPTIRSED